MSSLAVHFYFHFSFFFVFFIFSIFSIFAFFSFFHFLHFFRFLKKEERRTRRQKQVPFHSRTQDLFVNRVRGNPSLRHKALTGPEGLRAWSLAASLFGEKCESCRNNSSRFSCSDLVPLEMK